MIIRKASKAVLLTRRNTTGQRRAVAHDCPDPTTLAHLRSVLAAAGALPSRDERLVKLERWITAAISTRDDADERRILHGYAIWHHLRRLRQRLGEAHATHLQALNVRCHVTAAASFLDWLTAENLHAGVMHPARPGPMGIQHRRQLPGPDRPLRPLVGHPPARQPPDVRCRPLGRPLRPARRRETLG
jgi:hypothetical protein